MALDSHHGGPDRRGCRPVVDRAAESAAAPSGRPMATTAASRSRATRPSWDPPLLRRVPRQPWWASARTRRQAPRCRASGRQVPDWTSPSSTSLPRPADQHADP